MCLCERANNFASQSCEFGGDSVRVCCSLSSLRLRRRLRLRLGRATASWTCGGNGIGNNSLLRKWTRRLLAVRTDAQFRNSNADGQMSFRVAKAARATRSCSCCYCCAAGLASQWPLLLPLQPPPPPPPPPIRQTSFSESSRFSSVSAHRLAVAQHLRRDLLVLLVGAALGFYWRSPIQLSCAGLPQAASSERRRKWHCGGSTMPLAARLRTAQIWAGAVSL